MAYTEISDFRIDLQGKEYPALVTENFIVQEGDLFSTYLLEAPFPNSVAIKGTGEYIIQPDITIPLIPGQFRVITGETNHCGYIEIMPNIKETQVTVSYQGMGSLIHKRTLQSIVYTREQPSGKDGAKIYEGALGRDGWHDDWAMAVHKNELYIIGPNPSMKFNKSTKKFEDITGRGGKPGLELGFFAHYSDGNTITAFGGSRWDALAPRGQWVEPNSGWATNDGTDWWTKAYIGSAGHPYQYSSEKARFKAVNIPGKGVLIVGGVNMQGKLRALFWNGGSYGAPALTKEMEWRGIREKGLVYVKSGATWEALETSHKFGLVSHNGFVYFLGFGDYGKAMIYKTTDGSEWEPVVVKNDGRSLGNGSQDYVSWNGYIWTIGAGNYNEIWRSKDGVEWSKVTNDDGSNILPGNFNYVDCVVFENRVYILSSSDKRLVVLMKSGIGGVGVEIGLHANAKGYSSIAIGTDAVAIGHNSAAFGAGATSPLDNTIVLGGTSAVVQTHSAVTTSDKRDKVDIQPSNLGLDFIKGLKPCAYKDNREALYERYIDGDRYVDRDAHAAGVLKRSRTHHGFIAQDVLALQKEQLDDTDAMKFAAVKRIGGVADDDEITGDGRSTLAIDYLEFIAPLTKAIQELSDKLERLEQ